MAVVAHLVQRVADPGDFVIDGIEAVIIAIDDAVDTTDALIRARARTVINTALGANKLPVGYFTANRGVAAVWNAAGDVTVFSGKSIHEAIA